MRAIELPMSERTSVCPDLSTIHEFLGALSHELRGPLAPFYNGLQILKLKGVDSEISREILALMERQLRDMTGLLDNLLEVSRLVRGRIALRHDHFDLGRLTRVVFDEVTAKLLPNRVHCSLQVPEQPVWVLGDAVRLARVLSTLLHNAVRFTDAGGTIIVRLESDASEHKAVLQVRDTGVGIEKERLLNLFHSFPSAGTDSARHSASLDLGVTFVKTVIEQHGGDVRVASEGHGRGTEFTVTLPLQGEPAPVTANSPLPDAAADRHLRILVIEDNRDSAESLRILLSACGYEVHVSFTGTDGVKAAQEKRPDVVLCDIGLPGLNGYEVVSELRRHAETASARVIALTGYGADEDRRKAKLAGFDLHLVKPVEPRVLEEILAHSEPAA